MVPGAPACVGEERERRHPQRGKGRKAPARPRDIRVCTPPGKGEDQDHREPTEEDRKQAAAQQEGIEEDVEQCIDVDLKRHMKECEVTIRGQAVAGDERGAGDELMLVVVQLASHIQAEKKQEEQCQ